MRHSKRSVFDIHIDLGVELVLKFRLAKKTALEGRVCKAGAKGAAQRLSSLDNSHYLRMILIFQAWLADQRKASAAYIKLFCGIVVGR